MAVEYREEVVRFGPEDRLSGISTRPTTDDRKIWCVLPNSGVVPRSGVARLHVNLARALAEIGFSTLRFDLSGLGDSERPGDGSDPLAQALLDLEAAQQFVRDSMGSQAEVVGGLCSAAHDAFRFMGTSPTVRGVIAIDLISEYANPRHVLQHYSARILSPASWARAVSNPVETISTLTSRLQGGGGTDEVEKPETPSGWIGVRPVLTRDALRAALSEAIEHGRDLLFLFSGGLEENYNYDGQFADVFPEESKSPRVKHRFFPEAGHIFDDLEQQGALIREICDWMATRARDWVKTP